MGRISASVRMYALFSIAAILTGMAYSYSLLGDTALALASTVSAMAFIGALLLEAQSS